MKMVYEKPDAQLTKFELSDLITVSAIVPDVDDGFPGWDDWWT